MVSAVNFGEIAIIKKKSYAYCLLLQPFADFALGSKVGV